MALEGTLRDMSLEDLFDIFEAGGRSGRLTLSDDSDHCVILVSRGQIAEAMLLRGPERQMVAMNSEAVLQVCLWEDANFAFTHDARMAERPRRINASFAQIQEQALRRNAEPASGVALNDVIALADRAEVTSQTVELSLDEWHLVSTLCRHVSLAEVCLEAGMVPSQALTIANGLAQRGLLHQPDRKTAAVVTQRQQATHPPAPTPLAPRQAVAVGRPLKAAAGTNKTLLGAIIRRVQSL